MKIVVFFSGTGTNLESILREQKNYDYEVIGAFTNNPNAYCITTRKKYRSFIDILVSLLKEFIR